MKIIDLPTNDLLNQFVSTDELRPKLCKAVHHGANIIATDAHKLIVCPIVHTIQTYAPYTNEFPDYQSVIPPHTKEPIYYSNANDIVADLLVLPVKEFWTECERCEGDGFLSTHNHNQRKCDECEGTGNDKYEGVMIPWGSTYSDNDGKYSICKMRETYLNPNLLLSIARLAHFMEQPIAWVSVSPLSACIAYIGDIMVLIMPMTIDKEDDPENINIIDIKTFTNPNFEQ